MGQAPACAVVRVHADSFRIDRLTPPGAGAVALFRDRYGNPLARKARLFRGAGGSVCWSSCQGARSRIHPTAAEAVASTKLFTPKAARDAVARADAAPAAALAEPGES